MAKNLSSIFKLIQPIYSGGAAYRAASDYKDEVTGLPLDEIIRRVNGIQNYLLHHTSHIKDSAERRQYLHQHHKPYLDSGIAFLDALDYSPAMYKIFNNIKQKIMYEFIDGAGYHEEGKKVSHQRWDNIFNGFTRLFYDVARQEFCPLLKDAQLDTTKTLENAAAWVEVHRAEAADDFNSPIYINSTHNYRRAGDMINSICHEGTHHTMIQWALLVKNGDIKASGSMKRDAAILIERNKTESIISSRIYDLYRADPFERIAFRTGDSVQADYQILTELIESTPVNERQDPNFPRRIRSALSPLGPF